MLGTEAPASPDLSSLTPRQRLNIAVALTQGFGWLTAEDDDEPHSIWKLDNEGGPPWDLVNTKGELAAWTYSGSALLRIPDSTVALPDYAGDPAAWGALMEKESDVWAEPLFHSGEGQRQVWQGCWMNPDKVLPATVGDFDQPGRAVCAAVLTKHGIDPTPYIGE